MSSYYKNCVACSGNLINTNQNSVGKIYACDRCDGLYEVVAHGTKSRSGIKFVFCDGDTPHENYRYFDIYIQETKQRVHGFFDVISKKVVQFG